MLRIEVGIPRYGVDMTADTLLLETGLEHAVSFTKGCYLGQEIVERIHSRGHVNKRLAGLILAGRAPVESGGKIFHGNREIGKITSSAFSPYKDSAIALGYVQREAFNPGDAVVVQDRDKQITASLAALPIYPSAA
jgi:folate-binding protein YgfZ